jgi:hypothetical protein
MFVVADRSTDLIRAFVAYPPETGPHLQQVMDHPSIAGVRGPVAPSQPVLRVRFKTSIKGSGADEYTALTQLHSPNIVGPTLDKSYSIRVLKRALKGGCLVIYRGISLSRDVRSLGAALAGLSFGSFPEVKALPASSSPERDCPDVVSGAERTF